MTHTYVADVWLGENDSFFTPSRATAAEAFVDAMSLVGCPNAHWAFERLGLPTGVDSGPVWDNWWSLPVTAFNIMRLIDDEIADDFRGVYGRYKQPGG